MKYTPQLNVKSVYNFQNSLIKIDDYIDFAIANNLPYLFYFENTTMYGIAEFVKKCERHKIKPIFGLGIEIDNNQFINIVPVNIKGYQNICKLSSNINTIHSQNIDIIFEQISETIDDNNLLIYKLNNSDMLTSKYNSAHLYDLSKFKVFTNNIRYFDDDDKKFFAGLYALKNGVSYKEANKTYRIIESYPDTEIIENIYPDTEQILDDIASKAFYDIFSNKQIHFGKYQTPNNIPSFQYLKQKCLISLKSYFKERKKTNIVDQEYVLRLEKELSIIEKTGFADYFLIVFDYVHFAKNQGIIVGPGRGSAAGSLVSFLLQITTVDPIEYGLFFERFLNPERVTMPDIDIDFQDDRRNEVIEYLFEKYGRYNVATIVTYQTTAFKSAFRDACRVYEIDMQFVNMISKEVRDGSTSFENVIKNSDLIKSYCESDEYSEVFALVKKLIGIPRQTGTHAAGVIITHDDLRDIIPIREGIGGIYQTQFDMNYLEDLGLIKMDLLGLRNLTILNEIIKSIARNYKINIRLSDIDIHDVEVFNLLNRGETTGIFQLESEGMTDVIRKMQVASIDDIAIASSLFRPGPQEMIPQYVKNKHTSKYGFIDKKIEDILLPTYGIIVYQEQVMQIFQRVGNFSLGKADIIRRSMSKKQITYMNEFREEFINNAITNNISSSKAIEIWKWIEKFANYGFNKSHAIAYSLIGYWLAWFKTHYTAEFYAALLNNSFANKIKTKLYLQQLKKYGIDVIKPSIKNLNMHFIVINNKLFMPLTIVQGIGKDFIAHLRQQFQMHPDMFDDLNHFLFYSKAMGMDESNYNLLAKSAAFDCFGYNNITMLENKNFIFGVINSFNTGEPISNQQTSIDMLYEQPENLELQSSYEKEVFGFYINENPLAKIKNEHAFFKPQDIDKLSIKMGIINLIGQIVKIRIIKDKNNHDMAFLELLDDTDTIDITVFASTFNELKNELVLNKNYILAVKIQEYAGKITGVLNKIVKPIK